jgi:glyoxylase-like metal-dependent hydrolase (beta-lactamase superfamily II)
MAGFQRTVGRRVLPQVGWVRTSMSNSYVLREDSGTYLIDAGFSDQAVAVREAFRRADVPLSKATQILLTHQHPDHMGGAAYLRWVTGARVACHAQDAPSVEGRAPLFAPWLVRVLFSRHPVQVDRVLRDGDEIGPFTVVHTPGHTLGSVCYHHPGRKLLFLGDALVSSSKGFSMAFGFSNFDPDLARDSLEKLAALDVTGILSGHGRPVLRNAAVELRAAIRRLSSPKEHPWWTLAGPTGNPESHPHLPPAAPSTAASPSTGGPGP